MTRAEILEAAIQKAMNNGWLPHWNEWEYKLDRKYREVGHSDVTWHSTKGYRVYVDGYKLLFDHEFAQALCGEEEIEARITTDNGTSFKAKRYQEHLMNMALAKNPIDYVGQVL